MRPTACDHVRMCSSETGYRALLVCDMQPDLLSSLSKPAYADLITAVRVTVLAAQQKGWKTFFCGLRFPSRYEGVRPDHRLYGAFRRMNERVGDNSAHWFMSGYPGADIDPLLSPAVNEDHENISYIWRNQHMPSSELVATLKEQNINDVTVVGIKASYSIQATIQVLCDSGITVSVVKEAVQDDDPQRLGAIMKHIVPIFANVISLADFVEYLLGTEGFSTSTTLGFNSDSSSNGIRYLSKCNRSGHMHLYQSALLRKGGWRDYPTQRWYVDSITGKTFICPVGKQIVHFCDEPQFSDIAMFISGRESLDEKDKIVAIAGERMPKSYIIHDGMWHGEMPTSDDELNIWFLKEVNKNGGKAVQVFCSPSECLRSAEPNQKYVAQRHISSPLLAKDGRKFHVKVYYLLRSSIDGTSTPWTLYSCKECFLSLSSKSWSPNDTSNDAQITTLRSQKIDLGSNVEGCCGCTATGTPWSEVYHRCNGIVADTINEAVQKKKITTRPNKEQFEILSSDFLLDTSMNIWLVEFNFTPVLYDPLANQQLTTRGLKLYDEIFRSQGSKAEVNDSKMISDAVDLVFGTDGARNCSSRRKGGDDGSLWEIVLK